MGKLFIVLVLLCLQLLQYVSCTRLNGFSSAERLLTLVRGGARGKGAKQSQPVARSKRRSNRRDDFDDDNDDNDDDYDDYEEEEDHRSSKKRGGRSGRPSRRSSSRRKSGGRGSFSLIPWVGGTSNNDRDSSNKKKGPTIRERLEQIAKTGQSAYKDIYRRAKVMKSSAFEGVLLKATWPSDTIVAQEVLTDLIKYSIPAFKYTRSESEEDPYYMTLHKLWTKMTERDWRTVTKSLYILHCISRDSSQESCRHFATALKTLSKARNPKKPDQKYYDIKIISDLDPNSQSYQAFIKSYSAYIIHRAKSFSGKFEEFKEFLSSNNNKNDQSPSQKKNKEETTPPTPSSTTAAEIDSNGFKKLLGLLKKAQQAIQQGLQVRVNKKQVNVVTGQVMKTLAQDVKDLWQFYEKVVKLYLLDTGSASSSSSLSQHQQENAKEVNEILFFYRDHHALLKQHLQDHQKLFKSLKVKLVDLDGDAAISSEAVKQRIEELLKISGGAQRSTNDDDEEDEEDEENDDDENEEEEDEDEAVTEDDDDESAEDDEEEENSEAADSDEEEVDEEGGDEEEKEEQACSKSKSKDADEEDDDGEDEEEEEGVDDETNMEDNDESADAEDGEDDAEEDDDESPSEKAEINDENESDDSENNENEEEDAEEEEEDSEGQEEADVEEEDEEGDDEEEDDDEEDD